MQEKQQQKESNLGCYFRISIQEYEIIFDKTNVQNCLQYCVFQRRLKPTNEILESASNTHGH